jgi:hypothetical protein
MFVPYFIKEVTLIHVEDNEVTQICNEYMCQVISIDIANVDKRVHKFFTK